MIATQRWRQKNLHPLRDNPETAQEYRPMNKKSNHSEDSFYASPENRFTFQIHLLESLISRITELTICKDIGLPLPHYRILLSLYRFGPSGVRELARFHTFTDSQVSRALQELVTNGFVTRQDHAMDRRAVVAAISASGRRLVKKAMPAMMKRNTQLSENVDKEDLIAFRRVVEALTMQARHMLNETLSS
jgi:DNA-binding MarR family transcriptional regulator